MNLVCEMNEMKVTRQIRNIKTFFSRKQNCDTVTPDSFYALYLQKFNEFITCQ